MNVPRFSPIFDRKSLNEVSVKTNAQTDATRAASVWSPPEKTSPISLGQANRFAAVGGAHRAPDSVGRLPSVNLRSILVIDDIVSGLVQVASVDIVADKSHRAVAHTYIYAADMVARSGAPNAVFSADRARRSVWRQNRPEERVRVLSVAPTISHQFVVGGNYVVAVGDIAVFAARGAAKRGLKIKIGPFGFTAVREIHNDLTALDLANVLSRADDAFAKENRVAQTVCNGGEGRLCLGAVGKRAARSNRVPVQRKVAAGKTIVRASANSDRRRSVGIVRAKEIVHRVTRRVIRSFIPRSGAVFDIVNALFVQRGLLDVRKKNEESRKTTVIVVHVAKLFENNLIAGVRQKLINVVEVVTGEREHLEMVRALHVAGVFAFLLYGGKKKTDQDADGRDNDQQLDQRESFAFTEE